MMNNDILENVGEDEGDEQLPPLATIWECPMINRTSIDSDGKSISGWTCGWCPSDDGNPQFFKSVNATKALCHVLNVRGQDIRLCRGDIPDKNVAQYRALYMTKLSAKEQRTAQRHHLQNKISDLQETTVDAIQGGNNR
jgi:hypothetical protein